LPPLRFRNLPTDFRLGELVRTLFVAMGFTALFFLWVIKPAVEPKQTALYHWSGPALNLFLPVGFDFLGVWLLLVILLLAARLSGGRLRAAIWGGLLFFTPWFVLTTIHLLELGPNTRLLDRILLLSAILATILLATRWRPSFTPIFERIVDTAGTILVFAGVFGLFLLFQLTFLGLQASRHMGSFPLHHTAVATLQPHRVIWIVFDELSHQQTFERRFPGLQLPALDALAATSTTFTNAQPFDIFTDNVLPGLLAGQPLDDIKTSSRVGLSVHNKLSGKWQTFNPYDTVLQDALNGGFSTAVAGWYNPYCRIVASVVDNCYWTFLFPMNMMEPSKSLLSNMLAPVKLFTYRLLGATPGPVFFYLMKRLHIDLPVALIRQSQIDDYQYLETHSNQLLRDPSYGFLLLHLPAPHPRGIYDRRTGRFESNGTSSYIDNLALADKCLVGIRRTLELSGQWNSSTVIVMGDHSWRTKLWEIEHVWTPEDELATHGGQYDPRPVYIVKLPNQTTAARIDAPFQTVNTRKLFDAIMAHTISTPTDLAAWAQSTH